VRRSTPDGFRRANTRTPAQEDAAPDGVGDDLGSDQRFLKHMAYSVTKGRKLTVHVQGLEPITGYLGGLYNDSLLMLCPEWGGDRDIVRRRLISRAHISMMDLHDESTYSQEPLHDQMDNTISGLRAALMKSTLGRQNQESQKKVS
jgi:hypothetical protein